MGGEELGGVDPLGENVQLDEGLLACEFSSDPGRAGES
jgi:hypothetical protein